MRGGAPSVKQSDVVCDCSRRDVIVCTADEIHLRIVCIVCIVCTAHEIHRPTRSQELTRHWAVPMAPPYADHWVRMLWRITPWLHAICLTVGWASTMVPRLPLKRLHDEITSHHCTTQGSWWIRCGELAGAVCTLRRPRLAGLNWPPSSTSWSGASCFTCGSDGQG